MKFSVTALLSILLINLTLVTHQAVAASQSKAERWFEVEVILFQQLGDKSKLKEQFPEQVSKNTLPHYSNVYDILTPYLKRNLSPIKQLLPLCSNQNGLSQFLANQEKLTITLPDESALITEDVDININLIDYIELTDNSALEQTNTEQTNIDQANAEQQLEPINASIVDKTHTPTTEAAFNFDWQTEVLNSALFSTDKLCVYRQADFEQLLYGESLTKLDLDAFPVASLTGKLNASGLHNKAQPYLIADGSLRLKDINKRLRWSKEFKPLLHFGWRQVGITRNKAIPIKLFAGQHLANDYQQAQKDYQLEVKEALQQEQQLLNQLQLTELTAQNTQAEQKYFAQLQQEKYDLIFSQASLLDDKQTNHSIIEETIDEVNQQSLESLLAEKDQINDINSLSSDMVNPPEPPIQPWFLDGFFKVHLDHYLYITADFNIVSTLNTSNQASASVSDNAEVKLINFSQNRRVITGEVHYFDHPYIGMVVQIRRFDPTKPADQAVTQAIK